ncbi:MAG: hypothetical protein ABW252_24770 [Polyangiales bacterium]
MSRSPSFLALLLAPWFTGCVGPIVCPEGRDADGAACVCATPYVESGDGDCVSSAPTSANAPRSDDGLGTGAGGMRDGGLDLDATLPSAPSAVRSCLADASCADAALPDAGTPLQP